MRRICRYCHEQFPTVRTCFLHEQNDHAPAERGVQVRAKVRRGAAFSRVTTNGACPKCGGHSFKSKRSAAAKLFGLTLGFVGVLLMPKSETKCQTCGLTMRKG